MVPSERGDKTPKVNARLKFTWKMCSDHRKDTSHVDHVEAGEVTYKRPSLLYCSTQTQGAIGSVCELICKDLVMGTVLMQHSYAQSRYRDVIWTMGSRLGYSI